jgi:hypothetical protein
MARTAVVAGTATAVSNRVSRRQARRWGEQEAAYGYQDQYVQEPPPQQYAPPPPAPAAAPEQDPIAQLKELAALHADGVLTDEEFAAQKAKILGT